MDMMIDFPGGSRVDAHFSDFTVKTDQPPDVRAPSPFEIFLLEIQVSQGFPEKYYSSIIRSAELCAVKKAIQNPPNFEITTKVV